MTLEFIDALKELLVAFSAGMAFATPFMIIATYRKAAKWGASQDFYR